MYATQLLINIGEAAFQRGNRDPWAIYAHNKLNQKTSGCLKTIAIVVVAIIVLIFFVQIAFKGISCHTSSQIYCIRQSM